ncbi:hypothetical protein CCP1ISM_250004 [Azospirillaceae bacterium]
MAKNYWNIDIKDGNGLVPFFVERISQGGKSYVRYVSYYNPTREMGKDFTWWINADCENNPDGEYCQLPSNVSEMEAMIYDSVKKKWYYAPTIHDATDRKNWTEITKQVKDDGLLATPSESKKNKGDTTQNEKDKYEIKNAREADFDKNGWFKAPDNDFLTAISRMLTKVFGKGTPKKRRTLLFVSMGLIAGKILSDKKK